MKRSHKMAALLISFTFVGSMANATNFSKSVQSDDAAKSTPAVVKSTPVDAKSVVQTQYAEEYDAPAEVITPAKVSVPVKTESAFKPAPTTKPEPVAKPEPAVKRASSPKPAFSDKPYEIQTFDRTMLVCPDGYACTGGSGTDYKCVPDKTASIGGHGEVCKTTPRALPAVTEPAQKAGQKK